MKQNRFLGIFFAGCIFLSLSWSYDVQAMEVIEDAEGSAVAILDKSTGDMLDLSGKTEEDISAISESIEKNEFTDLDTLAEKFDFSEEEILKADSPEAKAFAKDNEAVDQAVTKLKDEKLSASGVKDDADQGANAVKNLKNDRAYLKSLETAQRSFKDFESQLKDKLSEDVKLFKGPPVPTVEDLRKACNSSLSDMHGASMERLDNLGVSLGDVAKTMGEQQADLFKEIKNAKTVDELQNLKIKIDKLNVLSDTVGKGLDDLHGNYASSDALKENMRDYAKNVNNFELKAETILTDATDSVESGLDSSLNVMKTKTSSVVRDVDGKVTALSKKVDTAIDNLGFADRARVRRGRLDENLAEAAVRAKRYISNDLTGDIADGFSSVGSKIKGAVSKTAELLGEGAKMLVSGVMFMIPNIFQSAFLAQKQRQSELQTLANPIKFGDWVFQIPDSCFNFSNPSATLPIYVRVPVENVGDTVSLQMATHYNQDVSGPTTANAVSAAIHSVGATIASFGGNVTARPNRYEMNETAYLAQNPGIVLAYFANNYPQWGSVPLTSSQFGGQVIDMNGVIIDGSGNQISATGIIGFEAYPLVTPFDWHPQPPQSPLTPDNMKDFCATMSSRMALSGDDVKYIEYSTIGEGAAGSTGSSGLQMAFDCSCLNPESAEVCVPENCAMNNILQKYGAGCSFEAKLLGSVQPLFGWGSKQYPLLINPTTFPGYSGQSQATAFKIGKSGEIANFADPKKNHASLGCWVYLSANTPFAQAVAGNSQNQGSTAGSYVDYIIFLNEQNEQVPLMVPVQTKYVASPASTGKITASAVLQTYGTYTTLAQNPAIKYWTSLAAFDTSTNGPLPGFADENGYPIKYSVDPTDVNASTLGIGDETLGGAKGVIASAITDLGTFTELSAQFATHQAAMQYKIENGPFTYGNLELTLSNYNITVPGSAAGAAAQAVVPLYQGSSCFGSFEDDLLVALDANNNYLTLPDSTVAMFYSLITDVGYKVVNNSLVPSDFSEAAMLQQLPTTPVTYSIVNTVSTKSIYNVLDQLLEESLEGTYPLPSGTTSYISPALDAYVMAQRKSWVANFDSSGQKQGITIGDLTCSFPAEFNTTVALASNAFFYEIVPNPSAVFCDKDLFILTTSSQPTLANLTPINAEDAEEASTYAVSLVTGFVFDMHGNQVMNGTVPVRVTTPVASVQTMNGSMNKSQTITGQIYTKMITQFDFANFTTQSFEQKYHNWSENYEVQMHRPMGPFSFGSLNVGIFAGDEAIGNYVYFPAQNMHQEDFVPSDVYVACQGTFPQLTMPVAFNEQTTYMMSLISGNLYDSNNTSVSRLPSEAVLQQTDSLIDGWGNWLKNTVTDLQEAMTKRLAAEQNEQAELDAALGSIQSPKYMLPSVVKEIISGLTPGGIQGLFAPYGLLQYNPVKEIYVHVSPLSGNESDGMLYLIFDVGVDKATNQHVGGIYTADGKFVRLVKGLELEVMEKQFGVVVNSDGSQTLGIPLTQPFFKMQHPSALLTLGQNSSDGDLISSLSDQFPGGPVRMAKNFYLYFSMSMKTYYIYDSESQRWISSVGGHVYSKNGLPIPLSQKVAMLQSTKSKGKSTTIATADDMILLYDNVKDAEQGYMSNGQNYINLGVVDANNNEMSWSSLETESDITVTKNAAGTTYTVVDDAGSSKIYKISSDVVWHSLFAVPIDERGALLQKAVSSSYRNTQLVTAAGKPTHLLFHEVMYKVSSKKGNEYLMVPVIKTNNSQITMTKAEDEDTGAQYISIFDGKDTYKYMYLMDQLDEDQQSFYRAKFVGTTSVATVAFPVGPVTSKVVTIGKQNITVSLPNESSHVLFVKDISNVSTLSAASISSVVDLPTGSELEILTVKFTGNVLTSRDGRFFVSIPAYDANNSATFSYVSNGAYVDLYNGVLFDLSTGVSLGYCLNLDDWLSVLNNVGVSVMLVSNTTKSKSAGSSLVLRYRSADAVNVEAAQLVADAEADETLKSFVASVPSLDELGATAS
ncbi:hypothetical protein KBB68_02495 [Candidatus Babeliales bacterium]|nr:hypothetical protein [Candidatus Babeliales bacterium]